MSRKEAQENLYKVIDNETIEVTSQAKIMGFIDYGSVVVDEYIKDKYSWRHSITGLPADYYLDTELNRQLDAWEFLESRKKS